MSFGRARCIVRRVAKWPGTQAIPSLLPDGSRALLRGDRVFDFSDVSYTQEEYLLSGSARAFEHVSGSLSPVEEAPFVTRIVVIRPADDDSFNGTVWIEWLNVSGGLDAAPGWIFTHTEFDPYWGCLGWRVGSTYRCRGWRRSARDEIARARGHRPRPLRWPRASGRSFFV